MELMIFGLWLLLFIGTVAAGKWMRRLGNSYRPVEEEQEDISHDPWQ